ncbi:MAG: efflux RND transporter periplasmic adaptor subunit [Methylocystis sp.]
MCRRPQHAAWRRDRRPARLEEAKRRLVNLGLDESAIAVIGRARSVPRVIAWPAPQDGHVLERAAINGMRAAPGDMLFRIVDHSLIWVLADIAERDIALIAPGQKVDVRPRRVRSTTFKGRVGMDITSPCGGHAPARRIELPNPDGLLRGDMYAEVEIAAGVNEKVLTAPESAVIDTVAARWRLSTRATGVSSCAKSNLSPARRAVRQERRERERTRGYSRGRFLASALKTR